MKCLALVADRDWQLLRGNLEVQPVADDHRDTVRAGRLRKPYVLLPGVVAVAVVVGLGMGALGDPATTAAPTSQVATATRGPMTQTVSAEGTVAAAQTDNLSFGSSGTVTAVDVKAGDAVHAGQALATIDSAQLQANLASAQAAVAKAQAQLADDQSSGASADRLAVDEASVASSNDQLTNAQTGSKCNPGDPGPCRTSQEAVRS